MTYRKRKRLALVFLLNVIRILNAGNIFPIRYSTGDRLGAPRGRILRPTMFWELSFIKVNSCLPCSFVKWAVGWRNRRGIDSFHSDWFTPLSGVQTVSVSFSHPLHELKINYSLQLRYQHCELSAVSQLQAGVYSRIRNWLKLSIFLFKIFVKRTALPGDIL